MEVKSIAVIGAGTMGCGIALTAATNGIEALQIDVVQDQLDRAKAYHEKTLSRNVQKERMTKAEADEAAARITYHQDTAEAGGADWVVEAATENADLKKKIFQQMVDVFGSDVVLATNTSSISITDIASSVGENVFS